MIRITRFWGFFRNAWRTWYPSYILHLVNNIGGLCVSGPRSYFKCYCQVSKLIKFRKRDPFEYNTCVPNDFCTMRSILIRHLLWGRISLASYAEQQAPVNHCIVLFSLLHLLSSSPTLKTQETSLFSEVFIYLSWNVWRVTHLSQEDTNLLQSQEFISFCYVFNGFQMFQNDSCLWNRFSLIW